MNMVSETLPLLSSDMEFSQDLGDFLATCPKKNSEQRFNCKQVEHKFINFFAGSFQNSLLYEQSTNVDARLTSQTLSSADSCQGLRAQAWASSSVWTVRRPCK